MILSGMILLGFGVFGSSLPDVKAGDSFKRVEILSDSFRLDWEIFSTTRRVEFTVTAETKGFVGFGLSRSGGMNGADIFIGGVDAEGVPYYGDYYAAENGPPVKDKQNDWHLVEAKEEGNTTFLKFWRLWNTCDEKDVPMNNDSVSFIWAVGQSDQITYHQDMRGQVQTFPLDEYHPPLDVSIFPSFQINYTMQILPEEDIYSCTFHKVPNFDSKHHIVQISPVLEGEGSRKHVHHMVFYLCRPPSDQDADEVFQKWVGSGGIPCRTRELAPPESYCQQVMFGWSLGGGNITFPPDVGLPIGDQGSPISYVMLEIHIDNPQKLGGLVFNTGFQMYYTDHLLQYSAGTFRVMHETSLDIVVPPRSNSFQVAGHCDPFCTEEYLPSGGINVFGVYGHTHIIGKKVTLRHFRGKKELAWILRDDNYNFAYQQLRPIPAFVKVLPGDQLVTECTYDNSGREVATIGGLSTRHEMCQSVLFYFPKADLEDCRSQYQETDWLSLFEIEISKRETPSEDVTLTSPELYRGMKYSEFLNHKVNWTKEFQEQLQGLMKGKSVGKCFTGEGIMTAPHPISYPTDFVEYHSSGECHSEGSKLEPATIVLLCSTVGTLRRQIF